MARFACPSLVTARARACCACLRPAREARFAASFAVLRIWGQRRNSPSAQTRCCNAHDARWDGLGSSRLCPLLRGRLRRLRRCRPAVAGGRRMTEVRLQKIWHAPQTAVQGGCACVHASSSYFTGLSPCIGVSGDAAIAQSALCFH